MNANEVKERKAGSQVFYDSDTTKANFKKLNAVPFINDKQHFFF